MSEQNQFKHYRGRIRIEPQEQPAAGEWTINDRGLDIGGETIMLPHEKAVKIKNVHTAALQSQQEDVRRLIEAAFREGYKEGYSNGSSDCANFECGAGSKHEATLRREQDEAWKQSDAAMSREGQSDEPCHFCEGLGCEHCKGTGSYAEYCKDEPAP